MDERPGLEAAAAAFLEAAYLWPGPVMDEAAENLHAALVRPAEPEPGEDEETALAYAALGEAIRYAIRYAAMLRTESVTIKAPLARFLLAALSEGKERDG